MNFENLTITFGIIMLGIGFVIIAAIPVMDIYLEKYKKIGVTK